MTGEKVDEAQDRLLSAIAQGAQWPDLPGPRHAMANTVTLKLAAVPESVKEARDFARSRLRAWGLTGMSDDVELVVSELVTNSLRYATTSLGTALETPIHLSLLCARGRLTCAVTDPSDEMPVQREPDFISQTGRGLHLVEAFSDSWNWVPLYDRGKIVWACFHID